MIRFINAKGLGSWHFDDKRGKFTSSLLRAIRADKNKTTVDLLPPDDLDCLVYSAYFNSIGSFANNAFTANEEVATFWNFGCNTTKRACFSYHWS